MLKTQIVDADGTVRSLRWGWWHVTVMEDAASAEGVELRDTGECVLTRWHGYVDPDDGEILDLPEGTTLRLWRD